MLKTDSQKGISIYLAVLIMTVLLGISLGISTIFIGRLESIKGLGTSVMALYGADTGIELALYEDRKNCIDLLADARRTCLQNILPTGVQPPLSNGATYELELTAPGANCPGTTYCVKSIGRYNGAQRAIQIGR